MSKIIVGRGGVNALAGQFNVERTTVYRALTKNKGVQSGAIRAAALKYYDGVELAPMCSTSFTGDDMVQDFGNGVVLSSNRTTGVSRLMKDDTLHAEREITTIEELMELQVEAMTLAQTV